jgi:hypothetical protein
MEPAPASAPARAGADEARYRSMIESAPAYFYLADPQDSSTPDLWSQVLHPEDRVRVLSEFAECGGGGRPFRCSGVDELHRFVQTVVSAGQMGVPMVDALRVQADEVRWRRRDRARVKGSEAPIKMTIPMVLFIFPTLWIILLGPSILLIMSHGL